MMEAGSACETSVISYENTAQYPRRLTAIFILPAVIT
jgi:hypothetical protein